MKGFAGKVLHVDLSKSEARVSSVGRDVFEEFIGGFGLCVKLISDAIPPGATPFSPENPIVIGAGPLVGTDVPAASRLYAFTKLPANNAVGWGGAGGVTFACNLRFAGYDAVVITGKAENPSVVRIEDGDVEICDAGHLWGYGIKETCERIWEDFGYGGVVAIGPAGENLIRFSMAFVDRLSTMGRGGIGAVFGSKNLKAVFVRGTGEVEVADRKRYEELCNKLLEEMKN